MGKERLNVKPNLGSVHKDQSTERLSGDKASSFLTLTAVCR
jgi:hypothetical protein